MLLLIAVTPETGQSIQSTGSPDVHLSSNVFFRSPWGSWGVPRPDKVFNPCSALWVYLQVSYLFDVPHNLPKGGAQEPSWSNAWCLLTQKSSGLNPSALRMSELLTPTSVGKPSHPKVWPNFGGLYLQSHSFSLYPKLVPMGNSGNLSWLVNRRLCLPAQLSLHHNSLIQRLCHWVPHQSNVFI